jgi:hypothetical protein
MSKIPCPHCKADLRDNLSTIESKISSFKWKMKNGTMETIQKSEEFLESNIDYYICYNCEEEIDNKECLYKLGF